MSQKEQEAALDEKIERIRKKNEEIERRRKEVEADKLNAEKLNAAVKFTPSESTDRQPISRPPVTNKNPRFEKKVPDKSYSPKPPPHVKKFANFSEDDGPPPDPVYTFLSDHSRDQPRGDYSSNANASKENSSGDEFRGQRGRGRGRGWNRGRGSPVRGGRRGGNSGNQFSRQGPQQPPEYQAWRAERERIDQDRITRQKTAEGNWRREWDSEKLSQDENQESQARPSFSKRKKKDSEEFKIQRTVANELAIASPPSKENETRFSDKSVSKHFIAKGIPEDKKSVAFNFSEGASFNEINDNYVEEAMGFEHRHISSCGDSIKISVSNKPIRSVKVNPVNAAGTGRVGPRQKPRLSYSSQSEDEKEIHAPVFHRRAPPAFSPREAAPLPSRDEASLKKPPLPPGRGFSRELASPKKKPSAPKAPPPVSKREVESPVTEKRELSRESSRENVSEGGDDSWEDVATTSGNESADCSDADVAKKSDSSDISIPRGHVTDCGYEEETSDVMGAPFVKGDDLSEKSGEGNKEFHEQTEDFHEEIDEEAEMLLQNKDIIDAEEEGICSGVYEAARGKNGSSSLETTELLSSERITSLLKEELSHGEGVTSVTEVENEYAVNDDHPAVEEEAPGDEVRARGSDSKATVEPTTHAPKFAEDDAGSNVLRDLVGNPKEPSTDKEGADSVNVLTVDGGIDQSPLCVPSDPAELKRKKNECQDEEAAENSQQVGNEANVTRATEEAVDPTKA